MKYGCQGKEDILLQLNYMVIYAPDKFPPTGGMTMELAWATLEYGFQQLEQKDGRPAIVEAVQKMRVEMAAARELFDRNEINPACHKLQDVEDILRPLKVKAAVR